MTIVRNRLISQYKNTIVKMLSLPNPTQNMSEVCRLCLSAEEDKLPIFAEEDSFRTPLYFRILACVSVELANALVVLSQTAEDGEIEVSKRDGLPTQICRQCLHKVNLWHDFKRVCDSSQERLKEWFNQTHTRNNQPRESVEHDRDVCMSIQYIIEITVVTRVQVSYHSLKVPSTLMCRVLVPYFRDRARCAVFPFPLPLLAVRGWLRAASPRPACRVEWLVQPHSGLGFTPMRADCSRAVGSSVLGPLRAVWSDCEVVTCGNGDGVSFYVQLRNRINQGIELES
uniref:ZAD domain-containing protein n=1 Tax=Timema douglasi TaxID=61478 RepID=A0A7R8VMK5_TIMDO|nr:unnamed protein product [Timema douglasi]